MSDRLAIIQMLDAQIVEQEALLKKCTTEFTTNFHHGIVFALKVTRARIMEMPSAAGNPFQGKSSKAFKAHSK